MVIEFYAITLKTNDGMKRMICWLALAGLGVGASAQSYAPTAQQPAVAMTVEEMEIPVDKYRVITNYFWDNWFISVGGGAQVLFGDQSSLGSFGKRIAPALNFSVGKWFTPGLGLRLQYSGLQARSFSSEETDYSLLPRTKEGYYKDKWDYMNLHGDILFNVSQMLMGYNAQRVYNLIPFVGFGWGHSFKAPHNNVITVNFGIQQAFRLCRALDLNWELFGMATENRFDGKTTNRGLDVMLGTTVGVTWKFPRRGFQHAPDTEALIGLTAAQMAAINDALAQQIAQNNQLKAQLSEPGPVVAEEVIVNQLTPIPQSVFFAIGSAQLPATAEVNLQSIATFVKDNPGVTLSVKGYADSDTGSAAWNEQLSRERAEAVAAKLEQLGVKAAQMKVSGQGGVDTLTPAAFNRRVIIQAE
jgi:outer membrane protein OmpA-like peptidoglycan-associated protein